MVNSPSTPPASPMRWPRSARPWSSQQITHPRLFLFPPPRSARCCESSPASWLNSTPWAPALRAAAAGRSGEVEQLACSQLELRVLHLPAAKTPTTSSRNTAPVEYRALLEQAPLWLDWQIEQALEGNGSGPLRPVPAGRLAPGGTAGQACPRAAVAQPLPPAGGERLCRRFQAASPETSRKTCGPAGEGASAGMARSAAAGRSRRGSLPRAGRG